MATGEQLKAHRKSYVAADDDRLTAMATALATCFEPPDPFATKIRADLAGDLSGHDIVKRSAYSAMCHIT